ncbi:urea carboxylase-associated family protein [Pseudomonas sp. St316]|uniref:DUF1989 domain-containing protein n=1 Tax=Pseudomonas sp. St316 TaxID=2678257 RepID=UPI001BB30864|nr:urea carboxylase-associated family protein [Pseudomonas sp. St316]BBP58628.1 hypothetical protein PHLH4_22180 [Pseudomonas sp. St316]
MNAITEITTAPLQRLAARRGVAIKLEKHQTLRVINTHGKQVVDTWAFNAEDLTETMSMEHCRASWLRVNPQVGDSLISNQRQPLLTLVEDTSPGVHDTLVAACDASRYRQLGVLGHHDNCHENLTSALAALDLQVDGVPSPLNLFMNVPITAGGDIQFAEPVSQPGQYVSLRAEMQLIIVLSACPQDITAVNGLMPMDVHFAVM